EPLALDLLSFLKNRPETASAEVVGEFRRNLEIVSELQFILSLQDDSGWPALVEELPGVLPAPALSGPFVWRGVHEASGVKLEVRLVPERRFFNQVLLYSANPNWLSLPVTETGESLMAEAYGEPAESEEEIFTRVKLPFISPELRESAKMLELA